MMKKSIAIMGMLFSLVILLSGCTNAQIHCGINELKQAYLQYDIQMDLDSLDSKDQETIRMRLASIIKHYETRLGFTVTHNLLEQASLISMQLTLLRQADSYPQAFDMLKDILTNPDYTPFILVDMSRITTEHEQAFSFHAQTDLSKIFNLSQVDSLPSNYQRILQNGINESQGYIRVTLPATIVMDNNSHTQQEGLFATSSSPLSFKETANITFKTRLSMQKGQPSDVPYDMAVMALGDDISRLQTQKQTDLILCAVSLLLMIILFFIRKRKPKAKPNVFPEMDQW